MSRTDRASQRLSTPEGSARGHSGYVKAYAGRTEKHSTWLQQSYARGFISGRWLLLGSLLVLSLVGAVQVANDNESEAAVVPELTRHHRPRVTQTSDALPSRTALPTEAYPDVIHRLFHRPAQQEVKDVFAPHSWYVPPAPIAVAESVPTAPPLPFIYLGKLLENGQVTIFLARQDKNYSVREGDLIDDVYRVDAIKGPIVEMTYVPLKMKQTLFIGEKN